MGWRVRSVAAAVLVGWVLPLAAFAAEPKVSSSAVETRDEQLRGNPVTPGEVEKFAERERQAQGQEQFNGGDDGVYIGGGVLLAAAVVLIIILLLR